MSKPRLLLDWIALDKSSALPLYQQLYLELRAAIVNVRLPAGSALPSSRTLSQELNVSRNTVLNAYNQLVAEGYLATSEGSATTVAYSASETALHLPESVDAGDVAATPAMSQRGLALSRLDSAVLDLPTSVAFTPGVPAFDEFPVKTWTRLLAGQSQRMRPEMADNDAHIGGYGPLRETLTAYLRSSRMVVCEAAQVFVVSSARAALDLVCRVLTDPGKPVLVEEPGYNTAKNVMHSAGLRVIPVPVDGEGLRIGAAEENVSRQAQLVFVTPSHQWPMGVSLSAARRQELLAWAAQHSAWVVEDDYDSEFRFDSPPIATLQSLDEGRRVIYIGTFSKVLFPSLRTAYMVVPRRLAPVFRRAVYFAGQEPPLHLQATLAEFVQTGYFFRHIRRMRRLYKRRQATFTDALVRCLGDRIPVVRPAGGMQMALTLPPEYAATSISLSAATHGLHVRPVSMYALTDRAPNALHLGFAAIPDRKIEPFTETLASTILSVA